MQQDIFKICFFKFIFCITKNRIHPREWHCLYTSCII